MDLVGVHPTKDLSVNRSLKRTLAIISEPGAAFSTKYSSGLIKRREKL